MFAPVHVQIEEHGDVALVRIDRPPANAMDLELLADGHEVLADLAQREPGAVVLTGRPGFFSAGVDLKLAPTLGPEQQSAMVAGINRMFAGWFAFPRPVVAAVNGHAIAGGLILALCADYRVGATEGKLGLTELRAGIGYPAAARIVVQRELAPPAARLLMLRADLIGPERALELGVVDELAGPDALLDRAVTVAAEFAALPHDAYTRVKQQVRGEVIAEIERAIADDPMLRGWLTGETGGAAAAILGGS
jgi:enoyl-CoA hydratase